MIQYHFEPEVQRMLENFCELSGLRVGIHNLDMEIMLEYPRKTEDYGGFCFCDKVRYLSPECERRCQKCDKDALEYVRITKRSYIYRCHAGFSEAIIPILSGDTVFCVLMIGQVREDDIYDINDIAFSKLLAQFPDVSVTEEQMRDMRPSYDAIPMMTQRHFASFVYFLEICAQSIFDNRWIRRDVKTVSENFVDYIDANIYKNITIAQAAGALECSVSHLSKVIATELYTTFTAYLTEQRMKIAKQLLRTTNESVKSIAATLCYDDPTYFMRTFKRYTGQTCLAYRKSKEP